MSKTYIISEIGNTHEGSVGLAKQFIKIAALTGVDCVKFQTHLFEHESLPSAPNPPYFKDETRKEYFERTAFTLEQYKELKRFSEDECRVDFISSPFSLEAIDFLEEVGVLAYKIPSGEVTNLPLLVKAARTGKRIILSSGMSSWTELDLAVETLKDNGCVDLVVLQCTSEYPCPPEKAGLNVIREMQERYGVPIGYSDHTMGNCIPLAAVTLGAVLIEKHFTLSRKMYGSDAKNSTEPEEFANLVEEIRSLERAFANPVDKDEVVVALFQMKRIFEKSIVCAMNLSKGSILSESMFAYKKPGDGISASKYKSLIGKRICRDMSKNEIFTAKDVESIE